jgi:hypothetical protein
MGYGVAAYSVNTKKLDSIFMHSDQRVRDAAINAGKRTDGEFLSAAKELIEEGKATKDELGNEYFYAIEGIILKIGTFMPSKNWYPVEVDVFAKLEEDFQNLDSLMAFPIPEPDDFPWVLALPNNSMTADFLEKIKLKLNDEGLYNEFESWINIAKQQEEDLVLYLY